MGRPKKDIQPDKKQNYIDECEAWKWSGASSLTKRSYGMGLNTAILEETACHCIAMSVLVLNLRRIRHAAMTLLRRLFG